MLDKIFKEDELAKTVWKEKYLMPGENLPSERLKKVSQVVEMPEIYELMINGRFLPAGRILYAAGRGSSVTYMNCFYIPIKDDSLEAIFQCAKEMAKTYSYGGGCGTDISCLRPNNSKVNNSAEKSTGAVSFMTLFNETTALIGQKNRRGALMISIDCQHPDILEFIKVKDDADKQDLTSCNISVKVRDLLMSAVENDEDYELWYPVKINEEIPDAKIVNNIITCYDFPDEEYFYITSTNEYRKKETHEIIKARKIWNEIIKRAWSSAEPGVIFIDTVKTDHPAEFITPIQGFNPCSEASLPEYGACNLGSLNLGAYVVNKFQPDAYFDEDLFINDVQLGVKFLDKIVDINTGKNALQEQDEQLKNFRRLGLGIFGLADMLAYLSIPYDSGRASYIIENVFELFEIVSYQTSYELAKEKGCYPMFDAKTCINGHLKRAINQGILSGSAVEKYGMRNVVINALPPTGTISLLCGSSSGIEPIFELEYTRNSESLSKSTFKVRHKAYQEYLDITKNNDKPEFFKTAYEVNPEEKIRLQGLIQQFIDTSISATTNFKKSATLQDIEIAYKKAWEFGCKGNSVYREGSRSQVLVAIADIRERYEVLEGKTIVIPSNPKIYLTANYNPVSNKIVEVFINSSKSGSDVKATSEGFGRLISLYLQKGGEVKDVVNTLLDIKGEETLFTKLGSFHSFPDTIAKALQNLAGITVVNKCPNCGNEIRMESGCMICMNCGYSKC